MLYLSGAVSEGLPAMISMGQGDRAPAAGPWAADNGRFNKPSAYTDEKYLRFLARHAWAADRCLFATAPDVMGDAAATLDLSWPLFRVVRDAGYPVALVAQDGLEDLAVPWAAFDALFIGGTTAWKMSQGAEALCREAKRRGKWVHMGRVNSYRRLRIADDFGCDSADGTCLKYAPTENEGRILRWLEKLHRQTGLWTQ